MAFSFIRESFTLFEKWNIFLQQDYPAGGISLKVAGVFASRHSSFNQRAPQGHEVGRRSRRAYNALINAVNYHHTVISSAWCGKTISYHACKTTTVAPLSLCLPRVPPPKYRPEILFERAIFRKAKFTFIRPLYTRYVSRASGRFTFIYTNVYGGISTYFSSRSLPLFFFCIRITHQCRSTNYIQALKRNIWSILICVSRDNFFFPSFSPSRNDRRCM